MEDTTIDNKKRKADEMIEEGRGADKQLSAEESETTNPKDKQLQDSDDDDVENVVNAAGVPSTNSAPENANRDKVAGVNGNEKEIEMKKANHEENDSVENPAACTTTTTTTTMPTGDRDSTKVTFKESIEALKPAAKETNKAVVNPYDKIKWVVVENDGKPGNMIKLVGLKSLFAKQLPKMPRAYIARLVFDKRHISLAILSEDPAVKDSDEEIIGGICFRPFQDMRFAEIAFCAVSATHQVKVLTFLCVKDFHS